MRSAETSGAFVYIPPEGEDVEFVDAPQQPEKGKIKLVLKNLISFCTVFVSVIYTGY